jgi:hypothetical protein
MFSLLIAGGGLAWFGSIVANKALYPSGRPAGGRWPLWQILRSISKWEQDRSVRYIGGLALQFSGFMLIYSALFRSSGV